MNPVLRRSAQAASAVLAAGVALTLFLARTPPAAGAPLAPAASTSAPPSAVSTIFDGAKTISSYIGFVQSAYALFNQYILGNEPPDLLAEMQQAIAHSTTAITGEIDTVANNNVKTCIDGAENTLANLTTLTQSALQDQEQAAVTCVSQAAEDLTDLSDPATLDQLDLELNTITPMALFIAGFAHESTSLIIAKAIAGNQAVLASTHMQPSCSVVPSTTTPVQVLPTEEIGAAVGQCQAYNYVAPGGTPGPEPSPAGSTQPQASSAPQTISVLGTLPWQVWGTSQAVTLPGGQVIYLAPVWPAISDYSIAANAAMANTSWPVARAALLQLQAPLGRPAIPLAAAAELSRYAVAPVELARAAGGSLSRNEIAVPSATLVGWQAMDGPVTSVTEAANADGRMEMFATDPDGNVYHRWQESPNDDAAWSPWAQLTGEQLTSVALARNANGELQVFGTDPSGGIWTASQTTGGDQTSPVQAVQGARVSVDTWSGWTQFPAEEAPAGVTQVAAATQANGQIELFALDGSGSAWDTEQTSPNQTVPSIDTDGPWTTWAQLSGGALTSIAVALNTGSSSGTLNVFGTTAAGAVVQSYKLADGPEQWSARVPVSGDTASHVAVAMTNSGSRFDLLASDSGGNISLSTDDSAQGDPWTAWTAVSGAAAVFAHVTPGNRSTAMGTAVSLALPVSGGTPPYTVAALDLPPGLSYSGGVITGTPARAGSYVPELMITDEVGEVTDSIFTWTITGVTVPSVVDFGLSSAESAMTRAGLNYRAVADNDCISPGDVEAESPDAGAVVASGTTITLTVSQCPPPPPGSGKPPIQPK